MPMAMRELQALLQAGFPDAEIRITDLAGDDDHYAADIRSGAFRGLSKVAQHQLVYKALGNAVGTTLHALALTTGEKE